MKKGILYIFRNANRKIIILFVLSVLVFISFIGLLYKQKEQQEKTSAWVDQSNQIIYILSRIRRLVAETESTSRAFLITKDSSWINELSLIYQKLLQSTDEISGLLHVSSGDDMDVILLRDLIHRKMNLQKSFSGLDINDNKISDKLKLNGEGPQITREIVLLVERLLQNEDKLLTKRTKYNQENYLLFVNIALGGLLILFIFLLFLLLQLQKDISRRKVAEEKTKRSKAKYRNLIENAGLEIYLTDVQGNISFANQQTTNLTGYSVQDLVQKNYSIFVDPEYTTEVLKFYNEQIASKTKKSYYQFPIRTSSGKQKWIEQLAMLVYEEDTITGLE